MAKPIRNLNIAAPALKGLNTQDSPLSGDFQFASVADNVVFDQYGRLGSRLGLSTLTSDNTPLAGDKPHVIHEYEDANGNLEVLSIGNNKVFKGTTTLTDITPAAYTITNQHFYCVNFNDKAYMFCQGHEPLVYDTASGLQKMTSIAGASASPPQGNVALSAFGRLWTADVANQPNMVYWSDLLIGHVWDAGTAGSLNLDKVWPDGSDRVTALAAWNGRLIIFGYNSIVIYNGAESPATMELEDTINGVGCVARYTVKGTGTDLLFLSSRGLMSLGRTIQEKSSPMNDVSKNVRDDLINIWKLQDEEVYAVHSTRHSFYLLNFPTNNVVYCFDTRQVLENGAYRVTRWPTTAHYSFAVTHNDDILIGNSLGISKYDGYSDNGNAYSMRYYSNPSSFGDPSSIKMLKKIVPTVIGGSNLNVTVKWGYDFKNDYKSFNFKLNEATVYYYNVAEFEDAEFAAGASLSTVKRINTTGSGNLVTVGIEAEILDAPLSIQEFNVQAIIGRMY